MADEKKNLKDNAGGGIPDNIDELLENAGKSLAELSDEVGEERKPQDNIELEGQDKVSDVDSILSSLAAELENIGEEISDEPAPAAAAPAPVAPVSAPAASQPAQKTPASAVPAEIKPQETSEPDPLAQLAAELEALNGGSLKDMGSNEPEPDKTVADAVSELEIGKKGQSDEKNNTKTDEKADTESVDDILARLAQEISHDQLVEADNGADSAQSTLDSESDIKEDVKTPVESGEAVEKLEEVDSLGTEDANVSADKEIEQLSANVDKAFNEFEDAVAEPEQVAETPAVETVDDSLNKHLEELTDILSAQEPEEKAAEPQKVSEPVNAGPDAVEPTPDEVREAMPHAEDVLNDLDKQMKDLNALVSDQGVGKSGATGQKAVADEDLVLQELEDRTAPTEKDKKKADSKAKPVPFAENQAKPAEPAKVRPGMNAAQKAVVSGLDAFNKPLEKVVPGKAKETMGLVALVTLAVSMATLGFWLFFGGE